MKWVVLFGVSFGLAGCSGDAFDLPDAGDPQAFPAPPRLARLVPDDAGASNPDADASKTDASDAGCTVTPNAAYCAGACATTDGGITCGNTSNNMCSGGFYGECVSGSDCGQGKICALVPTGVFDGSACPPQVASEGAGITATCADLSYLTIIKGSRVLCRDASDCAVLDGGAHACIGAEIAGYPALAGEALGVCQ